jgi:predicted dehydrogenase
MKKLRIGFLSTAGIGKKNWKAIFHSGNAVVSAVASRGRSKSIDFIAECQRDFPFEQIPEAFGSYEELFAAKNVDAIYFPVPTALRKDLIVRAAENGKHILCEKPCAASVAELEAMLKACRKNSVQFLDGVMFMHNIRLPKMREILDDGKSVGQIRRIASAFSFYPGEEFFKTNIRANGALEPAGCLGDLGWYSIRFALWALNWKLPERVSGKILNASENLPGRPFAPVEFSATLNYLDGVTVDLYCSFLAARQQWIFVSGQKGWLRLPDFVHPLNGYEPAFEVNEKFITVSDEVKCPPGANPSDYGHATSQDTRMWRNFANKILSGGLNAEWPMWALQTQKVLDACLESAKQNAEVKISA